MSDFSKHYAALCAKATEEEMDALNQAFKMAEDVARADEREVIASQIERYQYEEDGSAELIRKLEGISVEDVIAMAIDYAALVFAGWIRGHTEDESVPKDAN